MNYNRYPPNITKLISLCALRFDAYTFEHDKNNGCDFGSETLLSEFSEPIVKTLRLHEDNLLNFAAFFILQRHLHKWGGDRLTKYSEEHLAYDFLFLHLYSHEVPAKYSELRWKKEWDKFNMQQVEDAAHLVRSTLRRKGEGKAIQD